MSDHWQVIAEELERTRYALVSECLAAGFTPPAVQARIARIDAALAFVRQMREGQEWSYNGPATVDVYGGGLLGIRFDGPFPQGAPKSGKYRVDVAFALHDALPSQEASDD